MLESESSCLDYALVIKNDVKVVALATDAKVLTAGSLVLDFHEPCHLLIEAQN